MPTLFEEYTASETAESSLFPISYKDSNDTTLSGSMLMAALDDFRRSQQQQGTTTTSPSNYMVSSPPKQTQKSNDQSVSLLASPDLLAPETPHPDNVNKSDDSTKQNVFDQSVCLLASPMPPPQTPVVHGVSNSVVRRKSLVIAPHARQELVPGPYQLAYVEHYKDRIVLKAIEACRTKYPHQIPVYKDLSPEKQRTEQERVLHLLERLQLGSGGGGRQHNADNDERHDKQQLTTPSSENANDKEDKTTRREEETIDKKKSLSFKMNDESLAQFSPEPPNDHENHGPLDISMGLLSPTPHKKSSARRKSSSSSVSSIEISRAAVHFSSPRPTIQQEPEEATDSYRKRTATSSGKRGADASRQKRGGGARVSQVLLSMDLNSPQVKIFSASQSPILSVSDDNGDGQGNPRRFRRGNEESNDNSSVSSTGTDISLGGGLPDDHDDSFDSSIDETTIIGRPPLGARGSTLHLKDGAPLHFRPLDTKRRRPKTKILTQSFPDPLDGYSGKVFDKMTATCQWIQRRLKSKSLPGGVVFSLSRRKIIDLCTKITLGTAPDHIDEFVSSSQPITSDATVVGQTLIVLRERTSLEEWKCAFREGSNLGVLSHCELSVRERKSVSTAFKCSKYGVVLTTFDALSSPDLTVVIGDEEGTAIVEQIQDQNGWFQGGGASQPDGISTNCKRLSVLHRLKWKRAIFVDSLGRKSFVAKPGTTRNKAAAVLAAEARLVFFEKDSESPAGFAELVKSDKKALLGVAEVLHADWERVGNGDYAGTGITLDYEHAMRKRTTLQRRKVRQS